VAFPLTSLTSLELKIRTPECLFGSYRMNSNIPLATNLSISCCWDFSNGPPGVVITPSFLASKTVPYQLAQIPAAPLSGRIP
jgi:hypothetical protein